MGKLTALTLTLAMIVMAAHHRTDHDLLDLAIVAAAIFGPAWFVVLMLSVLIGGPSAARVLHRRLGLDERR